MADVLMAKQYFVPALMDIADKYGFEVTTKKISNDENIIISLSSTKLKKEDDGDYYYIQMWRFGIEQNPPYRIRIILFRGKDKFCLSPDIVNEIDIETLYHIVQYLDSTFCLPAPEKS